MTEIPPAALRARQLYLDGASVADIRAETRLTLDRLYYWLDGGNGRLPPIERRRGSGRGKGKSASRRALLARMMRAAEHQMQQIEVRLLAAGLEAGEQRESARAFAMLARTMRDMSALEERERAQRQSQQRHDEPVLRDIEELRASLSRKLEAILASPEDEVCPGDNA